MPEIKNANHVDYEEISDEAELDHIVNTAATRSLSPRDQKTVDYLVSQMLWEQQEKVDPDVLNIGHNEPAETQDKP